MDAHVPQRARLDRIVRVTPVHAFALKAALWLPISFVVWFWAAALWSWPAVMLAKQVLLGVWPDLFTGLARGGDVLDASGRVIAHASYLVTLTTSVTVHVPASGSGAGGVGVLEPTLNPMVYAYSLPLFSGLVMATPLSSWRRLFELAIAFAVISLAQAFGIVAEALKFIAFEAGPEGTQAAMHAGLASNAVALAYQFGFLILPAVAPAALWIGLNRRFIEELVRRDGEPRVETAV